MIKLIIVALVAAFATSCEPGAKDQPGNSTAAKDTVASQEIKPSDTGYADVNGLKMYYEVYGSGKPLVLLHGSYMTIPMWGPIIPLLAKDRKVIAVEMQGHGRTRDIPREFTYEGMADDVSGVLKHLKIDSADVLGYSMGGSAAFQFAVRHPEQLRRLVIMSAVYKHDGWWPDVEAAFHQFTPEQFKGTPFQKQYDSLGNDPAKFPDFIKKVISPDLKPYDWTREVKQIKQPILFAIGDADGVRYEHAIELFRAKGGGKMGDLTALPHSRLAILPGTTHIGMSKRLNLLIPIVTAFLDEDLNAPPPTF